MPANNPRMTKAERRDAARLEAERLAAKQAATERRNRLIIIIASLLVVALVAVAGFIIYQQSQRTLLSDFDGDVPAHSTDTGGIVFGEGAVAGDEIEGAPVLQVYVDFMCPVCGSYEEVNGADIRTMLEDGDATVIVHPLNFLDAQSTEGDYSTRAAAAFALVATEAPDVAYQFMQDLFTNQPAEGGPGLTAEELGQIAVDAGAPQDVADTIGDGTYNDWVAVASDQARNDGVTGTPTTFIDGEKWTGDWTTRGVLYTAVTGQEPPAEEPTTDEATDVPSEGATTDEATETESATD